MKKRFSEAEGPAHKEDCTLKLKLFSAEGSRGRAGAPLSSVDLGRTGLGAPHTHPHPRVKEASIEGRAEVVSPLGGLGGRAGP